MIIERHYDDESLIALLDSPDGFALAQRDPHLTSCASCAELFASYRAIANVLGDEAMWDFRDLREEPVEETITMLRAFADSMAREDAAALAHVAELLAGSRETWMGKLLAHPEYRTAGTVRKLIAATDRAIDTMPPDALEITRLAVEIAEHLEDSEPAAKLRAAAWRERAYALYYVGNAREALPAIQKCISIYDNVTVDEYDRARADLVEALLLQEDVDLTASRKLASASAAAFRAFGDERRNRFAQMTTAMVAYRAKDFHTALETWSEIEASVPEDDYSTKTTLIQNIGACYRNLGNRAAAIETFKKAIALFDFYGIRPNRAKACWNTALLLLEQNSYDAALALLEDARGDFEVLGMHGEVTFVSLDIAETLLRLGRTPEVVHLCRSVLTLHSEAGLASSQPTMAALSYITEVASMGQLTPAVVHTVRDRLKQASNAPTLLFASPPN
ncbi:MAG TPA: tetratricopeptide repeat protein [Thermoanaerobaculia bacterium]|nr:tetratricopeptide repeat protein [Thermoanaerobaculia bacterium]